MSINKIPDKETGDRKTASTKCDIVIFCIYLIAPVVAITHMITRALTVSNVVFQIELLVPFFQLLFLLRMIGLIVVVLHDARVLESHPHDGHTGTQHTKPTRYYARSLYTRSAWKMWEWTSSRRALGERTCRQEKMPAAAEALAQTTRIRQTWRKRNRDKRMSSLLYRHAFRLPCHQLSSGDRLELTRNPLNNDIVATSRVRWQMSGDNNKLGETGTISETLGHVPVSQDCDWTGLTFEGKRNRHYRRNMMTHIALLLFFF